MLKYFFSVLIYNAALLAALSIVINIAERKGKRKISAGIVAGVSAGILGIGLILSSWEIVSGLSLNTLSVLLSMGGLFLGCLPILITAVISGIFGLTQNGYEAWPMTAVIILSVVMGLIWRRSNKFKTAGITVSQSVLFVLLTQISVYSLLLLSYRSLLSWSIFVRLSFFHLLLLPSGMLLLIKLMPRKQETQNSPLNERDEKLSMVLDGVTTLIVYINADLQYMFINKAYLDWYELKREDIEGRYIKDILAPEVYERALPNYHKALSGHPVYFENKTERKGEEKYVSVRMVPHFVNNEVIGFFSALMDITELKKAELENMKLIEELSTSLAEVKTLSGLLPICSSCKKIRDDEGYWQQLEGYIQEHSGASFSHALCPECTDKLYGKEKWYKNLKNNGGEDS